MTDDCLFCAMADGRIPVEPLYDRDGVFAIHDINPRAPVHVLIIPRQHIAMVSDLSSGDGELLGRIFDAANDVARQTGIASSGYRCSLNVGADAGQSIFHIHMHVLGGHKLGPEG